MLPSWLGFNISQFSITWPDFNTDPSNFQITLSASITSIQGLPDGVQVSGEISDAVIDPSLLAQGKFPSSALEVSAGVLAVICLVWS